MPPKKNKDIQAEMCDTKHAAIDKDINNINEIIKRLKHDKEYQHDEIKQMIKTIGNNIEKNIDDKFNNLKNKIVLVEKTVGNKIDALNDFDNILKGNGKPGVFEKIRSVCKTVSTINRRFLCVWAVIVIMILVMVVGDYRGISIEKIRNRVGLNKNTKKVEEKNCDNCNKIKENDTIEITDSKETNTSSEIIPKIEENKEKSGNNKIETKPNKEKENERNKVSGKL